MKDTNKQPQHGPDRKENAPDTPHVDPVRGVHNVPTTPVDGSGTWRERGRLDEPPAEEAITERDDKPAANTMVWAVLIAVLIMLIIYFFVFYDQDVVSEVP